MNYMHVASNWVSTIFSRIESQVVCMYYMHAASKWVSTILSKFKSPPSCMYLLYACCIKLGVYNFIKLFQSPTYCSSYIKLKTLKPSTQKSSSMGKQLHQLIVNNNNHSTNNFGSNKLNSSSLFKELDRLIATQH